jgi:hypothetical protein
MSLPHWSVWPQLLRNRLVKQIEETLIRAMADLLMEEVQRSQQKYICASFCIRIKTLLELIKE